MSTKYNIIPMSEPGLFVVNTTTTSYIVHVAADKFYDKEQILLELCRAIVAIERQGHIVTSAQELHADGHHPRIAFRQSKQYQQAKKEQEDKIITATYITYWDSGASFESSCKVNMNTHEVFAIQSAGCPSDDDDCVGEYVSIDDVETEVHLIDEVLEFGLDEAQEELQAIKDNNSYWTSFSGKKLDEELEKLKSLQENKEDGSAKDTREENSDYQVAAEANPKKHLPAKVFFVNGEDEMNVSVDKLVKEGYDPEDIHVFPGNDEI